MLMGSLAWWSFAVVMEHWNLELADKIFWIHMSYFGITVMPIAWLILLCNTLRGKSVNTTQFDDIVHPARNLHL